MAPCGHDMWQVDLAFFGGQLAFLQVTHGRDMVVTCHDKW